MGVSMNKGNDDTLYEVIIPIKQSAEFVKGMDFYLMFQDHFVTVYGLELRVDEKGENECEIVFKGSKKAIQVVVDTLKEMGLVPSYKVDYSKYLRDIDPNDYH